MITYKDTVRLFAQDCLIGDIKARVKPSDLYPVYMAYCTQLEFPAIGLTTFSHQLGLIIHTTKSNGSRRFWCKVRPDLIVEDKDEQKAQEGTPVPNQAGA